MPKTYTKKVVKWMLIVGAINGSLPYVLAAFGKNPVSELGIAWITEIVAVIIGYLLKSFNENKQQAKQRHEDLVAGIPDSQGNDINSFKQEILRSNASMKSDEEAPL